MRVRLTHLIAAGGLVLSGLGPRDRSSAAAVQELCDPLLKPRPADPLGYRLRGERCEGVYLAEVGSTTLQIASLTRSVADYRPAAAGDLLVQWTAPGPGPVHIQASGLRPKLYYRMDTERPGEPAAFRWPTNVLATLNITRRELGVVASRRVSLGGSERVLYLPVTITQGTPAPSSSAYRVVLWPGRELTEVYLSLTPVGRDGRPGARLREVQALRRGFYPADRGVDIDIPVAGLPAPGVYSLLLAATLKGGGSSSVDGWFYHDGGP